MQKPNCNQAPGAHRAPGDHAWKPNPEHYRPGDRTTVLMPPDAVRPAEVSDRIDAPLEVAAVTRPGLRSRGA
jgi:hypothetical protein